VTVNNIHSFTVRSAAAAAAAAFGFHLTSLFSRQDDSRTSGDCRHQ